MRESLRVLTDVKRERKEGTFIRVQRRKGAVGPQPTSWYLAFPLQSEQNMKMVEGKHEQKSV